MKKLVLILIALVFILTGCQKQPEDELEKETTGNDSENTTNHVPPNPSINIHGLEELEKMREMAESKDEEALNLYLRSVKGGGAHNREDLIAFLDLIDSLPILKLIDGEINRICHEEGELPTTGEYYNEVIISTRTANEEYTMIVFSLMIDDIPAEIERRKKVDSEFADALLDKPLHGKDGRIKVFFETRKEHPSGIGDFITWILDLDGIYTGVIYYTKHADEVRANEVFQNVVIQSISDY